MLTRRICMTVLWKFNNCAKNFFRPLCSSMILTDTSEVIKRGLLSQLLYDRRVVWMKSPIIVISQFLNWCG